MKIIELLCAVFCLSIFASSAFLPLVNISKISQKTNSTLRETSRDLFIEKSFRNTCHGKGFSDLREWQKVCSALFGVNELAYGTYKSSSGSSSNNKNDSNSGDARKKTSRDLLYCSWQSSRGKITVIDFIDICKNRFL